MRPDLTFTTIAATLAALAACSSKQPPAQITKPTEVATSAPTAPALSAPVAASATSTPVAAAAPAPAPKGGADQAKEAGVRPRAIGSTTGQMNCGAGSCSGVPKKK